MPYISINKPFLLAKKKVSWSKHNMLIIFILLSCLNNDLATVGCPDKKRKEFCPNGERKTTEVLSRQLI